MKKTLALVLALVMIVALAACGVSTESSAPAAASSDSSSAAAPAAASSSKNGITLFNGKIEIAGALDHAAQVYEAATSPSQEEREEARLAQLKGALVWSAVFTLPLFYLTMGSMVGLPTLSRQLCILESFSICKMGG